MTIIGCSYRFEITLNQIIPYNPEFRLEKPYFITPIGGEVPIENFSVITKKNGEWNYEDPVWRIDAENGRNKRVKAIKYGIIPEGFIESSENRNLKSNTPYLAIGFSAGGHSSLEFYFNTEGVAVAGSLADS
jgi:hypothetical protein